MCKERVPRTPPASPDELNTLGLSACCGVPHGKHSMQFGAGCHCYFCGSASLTSLCSAEPTCAPAQSFRWLITQCMRKLWAPLNSGFPWPLQLLYGGEKKSCINSQHARGWGRWNTEINCLHISHYSLEMQQDIYSIVSGSNGSGPFPSTWGKKSIASTL